MLQLDDDASSGSFFFEHDQNPKLSFADKIELEKQQVAPKKADDPRTQKFRKTLTFMKSKEVEESIAKLFEEPEAVELDEEEAGRGSGPWQGMRGGANTRISQLCSDLEAKREQAEM